MAQGCPLSRCDVTASLRSLHFVHPTPSRLGPCRASSASASAREKLPFGGAIVTKLAGSSKINKGEHHVVPLLGPGDGPQPQLPFGASVECFRKSSLTSDIQKLSAPFATARAYSHSGTSNHSLVANADTATSRMLDIFYVLAGSGVVSTADGIIRRLNAGDSLVAWHNTTEVRAISAGQPPAVLKFHFPASVLMLPPGALVAPSPSHADLQILVSECQGDQDGELSAQEAADILAGVQQRASTAIARLYGQQHEVADQPSVISASSATTRQHVAGAGTGAITVADASVVRQPSASASASARNSVVSSVVPILRGLLHSAAARAVGGIGLLRSALSLPLSSRSRRPLSGDRGPSGGPSKGSPPSHSSSSSCPSASYDTAALYDAYDRALPPRDGAATVQAGDAASRSGCVLLQRALEEFKAFRFPRQTNKLAFVFDPAELGLSLSFGVEVFEPGHHTPLHIHKSAHELFFVLSGEGVAFCNGQRFVVRAGDCVVFPPRAVHGIDNTTDAKLYCLQLMTPNEAFVEHVQSGEAVGRLDDEDLCNLTSRHC